MRSLRLVQQQARHFTTAPKLQGSPLFALGALSNSRETQHFNKRSRLDRTEHSPSLQLIKSSEVDPWKSGQPRNISSVAGLSPEMERVSSVAALSPEAERIMGLEQQIKELHAWMKGNSEQGAKTNEQKANTKSRAARETILVMSGVVGTCFFMFTWIVFTICPPDSWDDFQERHRARMDNYKKELAIEKDLALQRSFNREQAKQSGQVAAGPTPIMSNKSAHAPGATTPSSVPMAPTPQKIDGDPASASWWQSLFWKH